MFTFQMPLLFLGITYKELNGKYGWGKNLKNSIL